MSRSLPPFSTPVGIIPSLHLEPSIDYTGIHSGKIIANGLYQIGGVIGVGTYGEVRYAVSLVTGERVAIKIVDLARFSVETAGYMRKEISILRMLNHPNCIRIIDVHENVPFTGKWCESCACTCFKRGDGVTLATLTPTSLCAVCSHSAAEHSGVDYQQHHHHHHLTHDSLMHHHSHHHTDLYAHHHSHAPSPSLQPEDHSDGLEDEVGGETRQVLLLVQELAAGGELFSLLSNSGPLPEDVARLYFKQLMDGLEHLHSLSISHRDIKPEVRHTLTHTHISFDTILIDNDRRGERLCLTHMNVNVLSAFHLLFLCCLESRSRRAFSIEDC